MKKIDILFFRSFVGPFLLTFFIVVLFFVLQFFYVYIDDLVGKGLEWYVVSELIVYLSANTVPIALPLAVLLSALMSYGNLGERYELTAIKASGISLATFMRSSFVIVLLISAGSLAWSNFVMPEANLKFYTTLFDITRSKPALDIAQDYFYKEIDNYVIKIREKGDDGQHIYGVYIADQTDKKANNVIMTADSGLMFTTPDNLYLVLRLFHGTRYEVGNKNRRTKDKSATHQIMHFTEMEKVIDLSDFQFTRSDKDVYRNHYIMMSISQLSYYIDSLQQERVELVEDTDPVLGQHFWFMRDSTRSFDTVQANTYKETPFWRTLKSQDQEVAFNRAIAFVKSVKDRLEVPVLLRLRSNERNITSARIEWNRKYMLAVACLVLLFIGAPFGAIVRKGGFGVPVLAAILFFVLFYILYKVGEEWASTHALTPFLGIWFAIFVMSPIAFFFSYKAANDSSLLRADRYSQFIEQISIRVKKWFQ